MYNSDVIFISLLKDIEIWKIWVNKYKGYFLPIVIYND